MTVGRGGADTLDGGPHDYWGPRCLDVVDYSDAPGPVSVSAQDTDGEQVATGVAGGDVLRRFEGYRGSRFGDVLVGTPFDDRLEGGLGADLLDGP